MVRAFNRNVERTFKPDRKDAHWGKKKRRRGAPLKVFANEEAAEKWFAKNDAEDVAVEHEVIGS